jgi:hypothetical protein
MTADETLFRLVYASRNLVPEDRVPVEIPRILEAARRNNAIADITGALLFTADAFVQLMEGPMTAVEQAFERIQCDPRHADVVVLEATPVAARDFDGWSMAFAGRKPELRFDDLGTTPADATLEMLHAALGRMTGTRIPA